MRFSCTHGNSRRQRCYQSSQGKRPQAFGNQVSRFMRLRSQNRLRRTKDFDFIRKNASRSDCSAFVLYITHTATIGSAFSRFGIVVSKYTAPAVGRNRLKRIFREIFRTTKIPLACDILAYPRKTALNRDFSKLKADFEKAVENFCKNFQE